MSKATKSQSRVRSLKFIMPKATRSQGRAKSRYRPIPLIPESSGRFLDESIHLDCDVLWDLPDEVASKITQAFFDAHVRSSEEYNELMVIAKTLRQELVQARQGSA